MEICNEIVMKKISEIKPYVRNPRNNEKTVNLLVEIIPKVGFNVPIVIDKNGVIVKGHARYFAGIKLGMTELPCIITNADEEAIKADRITDNKISEFSEWVNDELLHELDMISFDINFEDFGLPVPTFDNFEFEEEFKEDEKLSDEERKKKYTEYLEEQAKKEAEKIETKTKKEIEKAKEQQKEVAVKPIKYYKCVCEKCGHVMFVDASKLWDSEKGYK